MNPFLNPIRTELLKSKRSSALWLTLFAGAFIPAIQLLICLLRPEIFLPRIRTGPWEKYSQINWKQISTVILPLFVILITNLLVQIEFRNNTWKQVYATPVSFVSIFFSKLVVIQFFVLLFLLLSAAFIIAGGLTVGVVIPRYDLPVADIPLTASLKFLSRMYISILPISVLQYALSGRYKNFIVPVATGLMLWVTGLVIMEWEHIQLYPYIYSTLVFFYDMKDQPEQSATILRNAFLWSTFFLTIGFLENYYRKQR